jgi:sugar O-acyltransferase (sialic acid O-acetyltransferase NeuD family)
VLAIGNPDVMQKIISYIKSKDRTYFFPNIIHPSVQIDFNEVKMGEGNVIFPNALFLSDITIGNFNFFNFNSAISHEVKIGDYCLVQPGVNILGQIILKNKAYCGANSTIVEKRIIGENAIVGAGAVVTKDVEDNAIVVGNPAKLLRYKEERIK